MKLLISLILALLPFFAFAEEPKDEIVREVYQYNFITHIYSESDFRGTRLYVRGPVVQDFDKMVISALEKSGATDLYIISEGGLIDPAFKLGDHIADKNITVHVTSYCVSACAFIAAKSKTLQISDKGFLAFHFPYVPAVQTETTLQEYGNFVSEGAMLTLKYMMDAGYTMEFVLNMLLNTDRTIFIVAFTHNDISYAKTGNGAELKLMTTEELKEIVK